MNSTEQTFQRVADEALDEIALAIETRLDNRIDVELHDGVLTIDMEDGSRYLINKHAPNREIWLASPKSGAWHFACDEPTSRWVSTRNPGVTLGGVLRDEIGAATGVWLDLTL